MPSHLSQQFTFSQKRKPKFFSLLSHWPLSMMESWLAKVASWPPCLQEPQTYQMPPTYYYLPGPSYCPWSCYHYDESFYLGNTRTALFYYFDLCIGYHGKHGGCSIRNVDIDWLVSWLVYKSNKENLQLKQSQGEKRGNSHPLPPEQSSKGGRKTSSSCLAGA